MAGWSGGSALGQLCEQLAWPVRGSKGAKFTQAIAFLKKAPPKKQIALPSGHLDWADSNQGGDTDEQFVLRLIRVVRNNLFHGGKFPMRPVSDEARHRELLEAGIVVMAQCLALSKNVSDVFEET